MEARRLADGQREGGFAAPQNVAVRRNLETEVRNRRKKKRMVRVVWGKVGGYSSLEEKKGYYAGGSAQG